MKKENEDIEIKAIDYAIKVKPAYVDGYFERYQIEQAFIDGANWALKNQKKLLKKEVQP